MTPGIVTIAPTRALDMATVTGVAVGETELQADVTYRDGSTRTTTVNPTIRVVAAAGAAR
jgi:hypothetical protein